MKKKANSGKYVDPTETNRKQTTKENREIRDEEHINRWVGGQTDGWMDSKNLRGEIEEEIYREMGSSIVIQKKREEKKKRKKRRGIKAHRKEEKNRKEILFI